MSSKIEGSARHFDDKNYLPTYKNIFVENTKIKIFLKIALFEFFLKN